MNTDKIYAESVVNDYSVKKSRKVIQLKKLDAWVKRPVKFLTCTLGIFALLSSCAGISLTLFGTTATVSVLGCIIGLMGIVVAVLNCVIYKRFLENRKKKYAVDIIMLAEEIIEE